MTRTGNILVTVRVPIFSVLKDQSRITGGSGLHDPGFPQLSLPTPSDQGSRVLHGLGESVQVHGVKAGSITPSSSM